MLARFLMAHPGALLEEGRRTKVTSMIALIQVHRAYMIVHMASLLNMRHTQTAHVEATVQVHDEPLKHRFWHFLRFVEA